MFDPDDDAADRVDWSTDFDDLDPADWEDYLGGPDEAEVEARAAREACPWEFDDD